MSAWWQVGYNSGKAYQTFRKGDNMNKARDEPEE
jgi:hypothetical protein